MGGTTATILRRSLDVVFTGVDRFYDGTTAAQVTYTDNRVPNDVLTVNYANPSFAGKNVGTAKPVAVTGITLTGADAGNYVSKGVGSTTASITQRNLAVVFTGVDKIYDGTTAAGVTIGGEA